MNGNTRCIYIYIYIAEPYYKGQVYSGSKTSLLVCLLWKFMMYGLFVTIDWQGDCAGIEFKCALKPLRNFGTCCPLFHSVYTDGTDAAFLASCKKRESSTWCVAEKQRNNEKALLEAAHERERKETTPDNSGSALSLSHHENHVLHPPPPPVCKELHTSIQVPSTCFVLFIESCPRQNTGHSSDFLYVFFELTNYRGCKKFHPA